MIKINDNRKVKTEMAIMIPNQIPSKASLAEKKIFKKLCDLPDDYVVIYSLGLTKHIKKIQGEIDFIVISKKGILCLEVKGGKVTREEGIWNVESRNGHKNRIENPFVQVSDNMYSLRDYLIKEKIDGINTNDILFACGVVIPDNNFVSRGPDIDFNRLINTEKLKKYSIKEIIDNIFEYHYKIYYSRYSKTKLILTESMINKIRIILRGNLGYANNLAVDLENVQNTLIELTEEQIGILDTMTENSRVIIKGTGGTGKTVLLFEQSLRLATKGKKVIFICYNKSLSQRLNNILSIENDKIKENIKISTLHSFMYEQLKRTQTNYKNGSTEEYFRKKLPQDFLKTDNEKYDILIIDEAQDILNSIYFSCLEKIVINGLKDGNWYMSVDEKQNLYNNIELDKLLDTIKKEIRPSITILTKNCRNTKQISSFNVRLTGIKQSINKQVDGNSVEEISYKYNNNQQERVREIIIELKKNGIPNNDIVILSKNTYNLSVFKGRNFLKDLSAEIEIVGENNSTEKYIKFSTIRKFKGLESKVVILCDVDSVNDEESRMLNYVAVSRAKTLLFVLHNESVKLQAVDKDLNNNLNELIEQLLGKNSKVNES